MQHHVKFSLPLRPVVNVNKLLKDFQLKSLTQKLCQLQQHASLIDNANRYKTSCGVHVVLLIVHFTLSYIVGSQRTSDKLAAAVW